MESPRSVRFDLRLGGDAQVLHIASTRMQEIRAVTVSPPTPPQTALGAAPAKVSVVIPTKNRSHFLREALQSVHALAGPDLELEVIVADDSSTDETAAVVCAARARLVRSVASGAAAARNAGLRAARGDFIAFLDDDDAWLPGHLRPHLRLLAERPELDAVVGQTMNTDSHLRRAGAPWPEALPSDGRLFRSFFAYWPQIGATVVRREVCDRIGEFDETLPNAQDWDWQLRMAFAHRVGFVQVPCVLFRQREAGGMDGLQWRRVGTMRRVFFRNLRRGGRHAPGPVYALRLYVRALGHMYAYFATSAERHASAGATRRVALCVVRAAATSPLHAGRDVVFGGALRAPILWLARRAAREGVRAMASRP